MMNRTIRQLIPHFILLLFLFALFFSFVKADIISVNSGGSENIAITPDQYLEGGAFSQVPHALPEEGGVVPPGGGGPGGGAAPGISISVNPAQFNIFMLINTNKPEKISVTNIGTKSGSVGIRQTNLTNMILVENTSISLAPGETKTVNIIFVAPSNPGIYNGTIHIGNKIIPVTLTVLKELILFDSNIVVLNKNYQVQQGEPLQTQVTLIPMGGAVRMDITLNYYIRNATGAVYLTRSETLLVESQKSIRRDFDTGQLPLGKYVVELELIYPYGVAPSSAHFEIIENVQTIFSWVIYWIIFAIIIVSIILVILTIIRIIRRARQRSYEQQVSGY